MPSASMRRMMRARYDIWRQPTPVGGKSGPAVEHLSGVRATPLTPITAETATRLGLQSPASRASCYVDGDLDIRNGDYLVTGGKESPIVAVGRYDEFAGETYLELIVQIVQGNR